MKIHEVISVFYGKKTKYNPQTSPTCGGKRRARNGGNSFLYTARNPSWRLPVQNYPTDVLFFPKNQADLHPTAKPVELCEYLIRTYTDVGDVVLDPFAGGGAVPVAAARSGRRCIGIEKTEKWYEYAKTRLENEAKQTKISWW